jgi:hypothetical protein
MRLWLIWHVRHGPAVIAFVDLDFSHLPCCRESSLQFIFYFGLPHIVVGANSEVEFGLDSGRTKMWAVRTIRDKPSAVE